MSKVTSTERRNGQTSPTRRARDRDSVRPCGSLPQMATTPTEVPLSLSTVLETPCPSHDRIAARAYQLWEANGRPMGTNYADWFEAEQLLRVQSHYCERLVLGPSRTEGPGERLQSRSKRCHQ